MSAKIYLITNQTNGKQYIGATITSVKARWNRHVCDSEKERDGQALHAAIRKYGRENFTIETLEEHPDKDHVFNVLEEQYIREYKTHGTEGGYNMTWGGDGWNGMSHSDESKQKMSKAHKGKTLTEEHKRKIGLASKGRNLGKTLSKETKKKISEANSGRVLSEEHRKKISERNTGSKRSEETKKKMSESAQIYTYELTDPDGNSYITTNLTEFCKDHNLNQGNMSRVCNNVPKYKSHKGWTGTKLTNLM